VTVVGPSQLDSSDLAPLGVTSPPVQSSILADPSDVVFILRLAGAFYDQSYPASVLPTPHSASGPRDDESREQGEQAADALTSSSDGTPTPSEEPAPPTEPAPTEPDGSAGTATGGRRRKNGG
jgi:hypothetical protein